VANFSESENVTSGLIKVGNILNREVATKFSEQAIKY
jgi:hypothetical protein